MKYKEGMYVFSGKGIGLGNVINCTPMLQSLSKHWQKPVPVYFDPEMNHVRDCFRDAPFMKILHKPGDEMIFHSRLYKQQELQFGSYKMPDYQYLWELGKQKFGYGGEMPHTWVSKGRKLVKDGWYDYLFVNGAGAWSKEYYDTKRIDPQVYKDISNYIGKAEKAVLGSVHCNNPLKYAEDLRGRYIEDQLNMISKCKMLISNEGGLAHAAAAMNKPVFIMWKNTDKIKNKNPGKRTFYSYDNHLENFKEFYKLHQ